MRVEVPAGRRRLESLRSAAARLGVSERTVRRRIADGSIPGYKIGPGRILRVDPIEVDAALRRIPTAGDAA